MTGVLAALLLRVNAEKVREVVEADQGVTRDRDHLLNDVDRTAAKDAGLLLLTVAIVVVHVVTVDPVADPLRHPGEGVGPIDTVITTVNVTTGDEIIGTEMTVMIGEALRHHITTIEVVETIEVVTMKEVEGTTTDLAESIEEGRIIIVMMDLPLDVGQVVINVVGMMGFPEFRCWYETLGLILLIKTSVLRLDVSVTFAMFTFHETIIRINRKGLPLLNTPILNRPEKLVMKWIDFELKVVSWR